MSFSLLIPIQKKKITRDGQTSAKDEEATNKNGGRISPEINPVHGYAATIVIHSIRRVFLNCTYNYKWTITNMAYVDCSFSDRCIIFLNFMF